MWVLEQEDLHVGVDFKESYSRDATGSWHLEDAFQNLSKSTKGVWLDESILAVAVVWSGSTVDAWVALPVVLLGV